MTMRGGVEPTDWTYEPVSLEFDPAKYTNDGPITLNIPAPYGGQYETLEEVGAAVFRAYYDAEYIEANPDIEEPLDMLRHMIYYLPYADSAYSEVTKDDYLVYNRVELERDSISEITFNKYLILDKDSSLPNESFSFEIKAGDDATYDDGKFQILSPTKANGVEGQPEIERANFLYYLEDQNYPVDSLSRSGVLSEGEVANLPFNVPENKKVAFAKVEVAFYNVTFSEPGIYRYIITEQRNQVEDVYLYDTKASEPGMMTRVLDVYVMDDGNGNLVIKDYVMLENPVDIKTNATNGSASYNSAIKSDGYVNEYETYDLTISKTVTGNQGSRDKYFKFSIEISGLDAYYPYMMNVDWSNAEGAQHPAISAATKYTYQEIYKANNRDDADGKTPYPLNVLPPYGGNYDSEADREIAWLNALSDEEWVARMKEYCGLLSVDSFPGTKYSMYDFIPAAGNETHMLYPGYQWGPTDEERAAAYDTTYFEGASMAHEFYLKSGQSITISGIPKGATYYIEEYSEDYKSNVSGGIIKNEDGITSDETAAFVNTRDGVVPTGIMMSALPGAVIFMLGLTGIVIFRKKRNSTEDAA